MFYVPIKRGYLDSFYFILYYVYGEGGRLQILRFLVGFGSPYAYCVIENGCFIQLSVLTEAT